MVSHTIPPELRGLAKEIYDTDVSDKLGTRGVATWGLIFDLLLHEDADARRTGIRMVMREYERETAKLEAEVTRLKSRRWWNRIRTRRR
jgi:hypothetical protein